MRELTTSEIERLASKKGVRRIAVENFLGTMGTDYHTAKGNLWLDAESYKWNTKTINALLTGIAIAQTF